MIFDGGTGSEQQLWLNNTRQPLRSLVYQPNDEASGYLVLGVREYGAPPRDRPFASP